jgi:predicted nuclease with TOPRIM domain
MSETEISDTRKAIQAEVESLRKRNSELSEQVFRLKGELSSYEHRIMELEATLARRERLGIGATTELDNHAEAGPA